MSFIELLVRKQICSFWTSFYNSALVIPELRSTRPRCTLSPRSFAASGSDRQLHLVLSGQYGIIEE